jgi:hypothetical protein
MFVELNIILKITYRLGIYQILIPQVKVHRKSSGRLLSQLSI